jgi:DNA-binding NarL/FixJ family response regulator
VAAGLPTLSGDAAASAWERAQRPYDRAITLLGAAEAGYAVRDRAFGRTRLAEAMDLAEDLGASPLIRRGERLARRARIAVPTARSPVSDPARLTDREMEVLELLAEGRTNPQIAQHLFLSPKTVGIHVSRVLEKLHAHTRGEAVATARRRGLLP